MEVQATIPRCESYMIELFWGGCRHSRRWRRNGLAKKIVMSLPSIDEAHLEQICKVLADTATGLTGSEIGTLLRRLGIVDPNPSATKRVRLYDALSMRQRRDACGNNVNAFIQEAMKPVRYHEAAGDFAAKRHELNVVLP